MDRPELTADCSSCFGLCCVALAFTASSDFATDKAAGEPCVNLGPELGCTIHASRRNEGYRGCTVYDCFGAGQQVSQVTFGGVSWRDAPETSVQMFAALPVMRQLHEMLWYLAELHDRPQAAILQSDVDRAYVETRRLTGLGVEELLAVDIGAHRSSVDALLLRGSALVRADLGGSEWQGADLIGRRLRDLRGAHLRGALLIAADLHQADLQQADMIGADLRDADLRGANLTGALYVTQAQLNSAMGDAATRLPGALVRPAHWER